VKVLDIQEKPFMKPLYQFIFSYLEENKLKIFRWKIILFLLMFTVLLTEFSVLIIFIQFFGIDLFTMSNSAIQLDLNFNFSRMNLLDKVFVVSKISLTYIKSLFIQFSKTISLFSKVMCLFPQIICFLIYMNVTSDFV
jgi:hypothetical protein